MNILIDLVSVLATGKISRVDPVAVEAVRYALPGADLQDELASAGIPHAEVGCVGVRVIDERHQVTIVLRGGVCSGHELDLSGLLLAVVIDLLDDAALLEVVLEEASAPEAGTCLLTELILSEDCAVNVPVILPDDVWIDHGKVDRCVIYLR